jgi:hypothetical protein
VPLHPQDPAPERILALGPAGSGKTTNFLNIVKFARATKSPARFYIMDSDFAMDRMITGYPEIPFSIFGDPAFQNKDAILTIYPVFEWREYDRALADIRMKAKPGDWVSVDFISNAWAAVQEHFANEVFHRDIADYFLKVRKEIDDNAKSLGALEGWVDWQVINALYRKWVNTLLFRGRYHLYCTAKSENLSSDKKPTEDTQTRQLFLRYGVKPVGQKDLPFQFHTLLLTGRRNTPTGGDIRTITAIKDREREEVSGQEVKSFVQDYLVNVANWKLV